MPRDAPPVEAAEVDGSSALTQLAEMAGHVLPPTAALGETRGEVSDRPSDDAAPLPRHNSVLASIGAAAKAAAEQNVAASAHVCEMAHGASSPPSAIAAPGVPFCNRLDCGTDTLPKDGPATACSGAAAQAPDAHNAKATATANANELSRR